jgi:predicted DNA-binding ribbon-helix-helix protein
MLDGHKTSISLENTFWNCLKDIAKERGLTTRR